MQERIKEHDRDIRFARTQNSAVSNHANVMGPFYPFATKSSLLIVTLTGTPVLTRLNPNNINRDGGIEIPEAWIPTIKKHNSRSTTKRIYEGTTSNGRNNNEDRNAPIAANQRATNSDT